MGIMYTKHRYGLHYDSKPSQKTWKDQKISNRPNFSSCGRHVRCWSCINTSLHSLSSCFLSLILLLGFFQNAEENREWCGSLPRLSIIFQNASVCITWCAFPLPLPPGFSKTVSILCHGVRFFLRFSIMLYKIDKQLLDGVRAFLRLAIVYAKNKIGQQHGARSFCASSCSSLKQTDFTCMVCACSCAFS